MNEICHKYSQPEWILLKTFFKVRDQLVKVILKIISKYCTLIILISTR